MIYIAYLLGTGPMLLARMRGQWRSEDAPEGYFSLGRWGFAVKSANQRLASRDYLVSVIPQLLGWVALALADPWRLVALAALLVLLGLVDHDLVTRGVAPRWFGRLRLVLSLGAGSALLLAAAS